MAILSVVIIGLIMLSIIASLIIPFIITITVTVVLIIPAFISIILSVTLLLVVIILIVSPVSSSAIRLIIILRSLILIIASAITVTPIHYLLPLTRFIERNVWRSFVYSCQANSSACKAISFRSKMFPVTPTTIDFAVVLSQTRGIQLLATRVCKMIRKRLKTPPRANKSGKLNTALQRSIQAHGHPI